MGKHREDHTGVDLHTDIDTDQLSRRRTSRRHPGWSESAVPNECRMRGMARLHLMMHPSPLSDLGGCAATFATARWGLTSEV